MGTTAAGVRVLAGWSNETTPRSAKTTIIPCLVTSRRVRDPTQIPHNGSSSPER